MSEYDVRAYGAKGDGSTNDTTAVQAAVNAAAATGGTVYFPRGSYLIAGLTLAASNVTFKGEGPASQIIPSASFVSLIVFTGTGGAGNLQISDLFFNNAGAHSSVTGILVQPGVSNAYVYYGWINNCMFNGIQTAIKLDQARMFKLTDIQLIGQSTIFVGSTTDTGPDPYAHRISMSGIHHYPAGATLSGALITIQRGVAVTITNLASMGLGGTMDGIDIVNDSQGINITNMSTEGALNGILCANTTVGSTTTYPQDITVSNSSFDAFWRAGFDGSGAFTVNVVSNHFTNFGQHAGGAYAIHQAGNDYVINDNLLWIAGANGNGITMDGSSVGSQINNNNFSTMTLGAGNCIVIASGSDYYEVQGNTSRNRISGGFIADLASGAHRSVQSTASWPN